MNKTSTASEHTAFEKLSIFLYLVAMFHYEEKVDSFFTELVRLYSELFP